MRHGVDAPGRPKPACRRPAPCPDAIAIHGQYATPAAAKSCTLRALFSQLAGSIAVALFSSARPPRTILVAAPRRIGDVLLTTPLVRSLKARWPEAQIDMLVFRGTEGVLEHNPDVRRVIVVAQRARFSERLRDALSIWRRYDLACAALSSDRPRFYSWFAGRKRVGLVDPNRVTWLTRMMLDGIAINHHESAHTVVSTLALAPVIGIEPVSRSLRPESATTRRGARASMHGSRNRRRFATASRSSCCIRIRCSATNNGGSTAGSR
jgi:heptosyltransferase-3